MLAVLEAAERVPGLSGRFRYVQQLEDSDARVAILEFATEVDGRQVEGIDKLTFDDDGRITELKVMLAASLRAAGSRGADGPRIRAPRPHLPGLTNAARNPPRPLGQPCAFRMSINVAPPGTDTRALVCSSANSHAQRVASRRCCWAANTPRSLSPPTPVNQAARSIAECGSP